MGRRVGGGCLKETHVPEMLGGAPRTNQAAPSLIGFPAPCYCCRMESREEDLLQSYISNPTALRISSPTVQLQKAFCSWESVSIVFIGLKN